MSKNNDTLVLFSYKSHKHGYIEMLFERLVQASKGRNVNLFRGSLSDLHIEIKQGNMHITESMTGRSLDSFGLVYFELWYKAQQQALAAARFLKNTSTPFFSEELHDMLPLTKVGEIAVLANKNIPLPQTFLSSNAQIKKVFKKNPPIAYPLIAKAADAYGGKNNFLVKNYDELRTILRENKKVSFVIQEFIPNNCDYRCLVFGGKIKLVLRRSRDASKDTHLNNTSAGALGEMIPLSDIPEDAQQAVIRAADALGRSQFAGVDLMLHSQTNAPYILEVNQTPQIEIGAEVDQKMSAMLDFMEEQMHAN